jgi:hypothetical protein
MTFARTAPHYFVRNASQRSMAGPPSNPQRLGFAGAVILGLAAGFGISTVLCAFYDVALQQARTLGPDCHFDATHQSSPPANRSSDNAANRLKCAGNGVSHK